MEQFDVAYDHSVNSLTTWARWRPGCRVCGAADASRSVPTGAPTGYAQVRRCGGHGPRDGDGACCVGTRPGCAAGVPRVRRGGRIAMRPYMKRPYGYTHRVRPGAVMWWTWAAELLVGDCRGGS